MGREKGTGSLQLEKSGRWTVRVGINGKRLSRSTGTRDRAKAEAFLQRYLSHLGLGQGVRFGDVWAKYVISPKRRDLTRATLDAKRNVWMHFARWIENNHLEITSLGELTAEAIEIFTQTPKLRRNMSCLKSPPPISKEDGRFPNR